MKRLFSTVLLIGVMSGSVFSQSVDPVSLANEYYRMGDFQKAQVEYKKLARNKKNISRIHDNYFKLLLTIKAYDDAEKYLKGVLRQMPDNFIYEVDYGLLFQTQNEQKKADKIFTDLITKVSKATKEKNQSNPIRILAQTFFSNGLREYGLKTYQEGRKVSYGNGCCSPFDLIRRRARTFSSSA